MRGVRAVIFAVYVLLWVLSHLLIYASRQAGAQEFNATSVVLLTELVKLVLALSLYLRFDGDLSTLVRVRRPFSRCAHAATHTPGEPLTVHTHVFQPPRSCAPSPARACSSFSTRCLRFSIAPTTTLCIPTWRPLIRARTMC